MGDPTDGEVLKRLVSAITMSRSPFRGRIEYKEARTHLATPSSSEKQEPCPDCGCSPCDCESVRPYVAGLSGATPGEKREPERLAGKQATLDLSVAVLQCLRESGVDGETIEAVSTMLLAANIEWFESVSPPREKPGQDTNHVLWAGETGGRFLSVNQVGHRIVISFDDPELTIGPLKLVSPSSPVCGSVPEEPFCDVFEVQCLVDEEHDAVTLWRMHCARRNHQDDDHRMYRGGEEVERHGSGASATYTVVEP